MCLDFDQCWPGHYTETRESGKYLGFVGIEMSPVSAGQAGHCERGGGREGSEHWGVHSDNTGQ